MEDAEEDEVMMMCCKNSECSWVEEHNKETDIQGERADDKCQNEEMKKNMLILQYI